MRHLPAFRVITIAAITLLASAGSNDATGAATGEAAPSEADPAVATTDVEPCVGIGDVFQLDVPGTYATFAIGSSGPLSTEVRGSHGELLATSDPKMATTGAVDPASGLRFGIAPPQVFEVESSVVIHVQRDNSPYQLVVVRVDGTREPSGFDVRPPVERIFNESGSCLIGDLRETFKIHTDAVYSDVGGRQVFLVDSPNRLAIH
jgi:hypothetical protein